MQCSKQNLCIWLSDAVCHAWDGGDREPGHEDADDHHAANHRWWKAHVRWTLRQADRSARTGTVTLVSSHLCCCDFASEILLWLTFSVCILFKNNFFFKCSCCVLHTFLFQFPFLLTCSISKNDNGKPFVSLFIPSKLCYHQAFYKSTLQEKRFLKFIYLARLVLVNIVYVLCVTSKW